MLVVLCYPNRLSWDAQGVMALHLRGAIRIPLIQFNGPLQPQTVRSVAISNCGRAQDFYSIEAGGGRRKEGRWRE